MLVLVLPPVSSRVSGFPVASPCLWGKLQNLAFCYVANCENWRTSRTKCWFFCIHVSCLESLVFLWRRRVYGGSRKNLSFSNVSKEVVMSFCVAGVALCDIPTCLMTCGKYQNWRKSRTKCWFFCIHVSHLESLFSCGVAVSMGEAGTHILFECFQAGCPVVLRGRRGTL